jgi:hypothetical protein
MALGRWLRALFFLEQWCVGYAAADIERFLANPAHTRVTWIRPERRRALLADPFGLERGGKLFALAEQLVYGSHKGRLVLIDTSTGAIATCLSRPFHLSYPFLVGSDDNAYVVPEQSESNRLAFYRLDGERLSGPVAAIEGLDAFDPTFVRHEGRWWLFCARRSAPPDTLHLFHSSELLGPYHPHPENPVVIDAARARPAGRIIRLGTQLLRPGQDCRKSYGAAITLSEIELLSARHYRERPLQRLESHLFEGAYADGLHTLDHTAHHVLIDSKRYVFHPLAAVFKIADRLRRAKTSVA